MKAVNIPVMPDDVEALEYAIELIVDDLDNIDHRDFPNAEELEWAINRKKEKLEALKRLVCFATK
jgi:hypothetical protein